jgi:hypothetical protein
MCALQVMPAVLQTLSSVEQARVQADAEIEYRTSLRDQLASRLQLWSELGLIRPLLTVTGVAVLVFIGLPALLGARRPPSEWAWWLPVVWVALVAAGVLHVVVDAVGEWLALHQGAGGTVRFRLGTAVLSVTVGERSSEHPWPDVAAIAQTRDYFVVTLKKGVPGVRWFAIQKRVLDPNSTAQLQFAAQLSRGGRITSA